MPHLWPAARHGLGPAKRASAGNDLTSGHDPLAADLAAWGKVVMLETTGRSSGRRRQTAVGFVEAPDGRLEIAAGDETTHWALNLLADPRCRVVRDDGVRRYRASKLDEAGRRDVIRALILKYGTPAERLGRGPAFILEPIGPG